MRTTRHPDPERVVFLIIITLGVLAAPLLPFDMMDNGPSLCVFHAMGIERIFEVVEIHGGCCGCYGCGMSRALWAILHGDINRALSFNWRIIIVAPILAALYFKLARDYLINLSISRGTTIKE